MKWFESWNEILENPRLRYYGSFLAFIHLVSAYIFSGYRLHYLTKSNPFPICYPGLEGCERFRFFEFEQLKWVIGFYAILSLSTIISFLFKKSSRFALIGLTVLFFFKYFLQLTDYRLATNYHFLAQVITFFYLFFSSRILILSVLIPGIYFCAGLLKFNADWLSGEALIEPSYIQGTPLSLLLIYVIILEVIIVWFLFSKNKYLRWATLFQLFLFHVYSWHIVSYPYPMFMFCILAFFLLIPYEIYAKKITVKSFSFIFIPLFVLQMIPYAFTQDPALDGRYRIFSFNMMDVKSVCEQSFVFTNLKGDKVNLGMPIKIRRPRIYCDPQVTKEIARSYCAQSKEEGTLSVVHLSRRSTEKNAREILNYQLKCVEQKVN